MLAAQLVLLSAVLLQEGESAVGPVYNITACQKKTAEELLLAAGESIHDSDLRSYDSPEIRLRDIMPKEVFVRPSTSPSPPPMFSDEAAELERGIRYKNPFALF